MTLDVAIVTQDEPVFMPEFYRVFFQELSSDIELTEVTILQTMDEDLPSLLQRAYALFGPSNLMQYGFVHLKNKMLDTFDIKNNTVSSIAESHGVSVDYRQSVNNPQYTSKVENIDVVLSVSAPEIFKADLLATPKWGCINIHTSELPKYRGMLPTFWTLYHGEDELGITVHTMAEEVDAGEIIKQETVSIPDGATLADVIRLGKRNGGMLAAKSLQDIHDGCVSIRPMSGEESYFSFPIASDRREFQRRGGQIL